MKLCRFAALLCALLFCAACAKKPDPSYYMTPEEFIAAYNQDAPHGLLIDTTLPEPELSELDGMYEQRVYLNNDKDYYMLFVTQRPGERISELYITEYTDTPEDESIIMDLVRGAMYTLSPHMKITANEEIKKRFDSIFPEIEEALQLGEVDDIKRLDIGGDFFIHCCGYEYATSDGTPYVVRFVDLDFRITR